VLGGAVAATDSRTGLEAAGVDAVAGSMICREKLEKL
jgi:hypothetical protein